MELIYVINILFGVVGFGLSFAAANLHGQLKGIEHELANLHTVYAKKEDVNNEFKILRDMLQRIEDKLDRKQDRS